MLKQHIYRFRLGLTRLAPTGRLALELTAVGLVFSASIVCTDSYHQRNCVYTHQQQYAALSAGKKYTIISAHMHTHMHTPHVFPSWPVASGSLQKRIHSPTHVHMA